MSHDLHSSADLQQKVTLKLDELSTLDLEELLCKTHPAVLLLPLGSVEPHGPHMPLATDRLLSEENAYRAACTLRAKGILSLIAPSLAYGVTDYATGFCGAITLSIELYRRLLIEIVERYLATGFLHVCLINHHLEPGQIEAIQDAVHQLKQTHDPYQISAPMVVSKRWGRALGDEFKSGACHAGAYEGSMILRSHPDLYQAERASALPSLNISLSEAIKQGKPGFKAIGMSQAYTGAPQQAHPDEGERLYQAHAEMVSTEIIEALQSSKAFNQSNLDIR